MKFEITEEKLKSKLKGKIDVFILTGKIGFAKYRIKEGSMLIKDINVDEQHRRKGIGITMVNMLKEIAKRKRCKSIWLLSLAEAMEFWKNRGFKVVCLDQMEFKINYHPHTTLMREII